ncbi:MAG: hypothetical protein AB8D78_07320 [Akkermansiaceae bacterium]
MKRISTIVFGAFLLTLIGCDVQETQSEPKLADSYQLIEEVEFDHHWASVRRIKIRGNGTRSITITGGGNGSLLLSPNEDPANEIFMTLSVDPSKRVATWWITHQSRDPEGGGSGGAGSPRSFTYAGDSKYLTDIVEFMDVGGYHAFGEKVPLVRFLDPASGHSDMYLIIK